VESKKDDLDSRFRIPFDTVGMDFLDLGKAGDGNRYLLVVTDYVTRWAIAIPTRDRKATTVAETLVMRVICQQSAPAKLLSDQGAEFLSEVKYVRCL
jgi:IS30 family transposase